MLRRAKRTVGAAIVAAIVIGWVTWLAGPQTAEAVRAGEESVHSAHFMALLDEHRNLGYDELVARLPERDYLTELSFDPAKATHFDLVREKLELTDDELTILRSRGFVSSDQSERYSFPSAYYEIYSSDLPVLVTTDSILHAFHRGYERVLIELEYSLFRPMLEQVLADSHDMLATYRDERDDEILGASVRDVDLYLTVARRLIKVPKPRKPEEPPEPPIASRFGVDAKVDEVLARIASRGLETFDGGGETSIYGGRRPVDYSQFEPRGHYVLDIELERYFECSMWLGRADCGWNVLPPDPESGLQCDADRELRNALLLAELLDRCNGLERLATVDDLLRLLVGRCDNLTPFAMRDLAAAARTGRFADVRNAETLAALRRELREADAAGQQIRSQVIGSNPHDDRRVPPPDLFQMMGQRFVIDSFVLSHQVFDSILYHGEKQRRMMPSGLDVAATFGNVAAIPLLEKELRTWNYSANLLAGREFVAAAPDEVWDESLYNTWLGALRELHASPEPGTHVPEVMRTRAWQRKQLQTQLASWSELRHDTILYAKPSYTANPLCEYPAGYVEPYPRVYARLRSFAERAGRMLRDVRVADDAPRREYFKEVRDQQVTHFERMAEIMGTLEAIANRELRADPLTEEQSAFLEQVIDQRGSVKFGSGGRARYDGWYPDLIYGDRAKVMDWVPTIADVHTDPESQTVLEVGTGSTQFLVAVIDNDGDLCTYVGPAYSYYEFTHPAGHRLSDTKWQRLLSNGEAPPRPEWISEFQAKPSRRSRHAPSPADSEN